MHDSRLIHESIGNALPINRVWILAPSCRSSEETQIVASMELMLGFVSRTNVRSQSRCSTGSHSSWDEMRECGLQTDLVGQVQVLFWTYQWDRLLDGVQQIYRSCEVTLVCSKHLALLRR